MTDFRLYLNTLVLLFPVFTSGACMLLTSFSRWNCFTQQEKKLKNIVILYLLMTFLSWFSVFFYLFSAKTFVCLNIICITGFVMTPIFFFRMIRLLTRMEEKEQFSRLHYLIPALIGAVFLGWSLFVPFDVQVAIVESRELYFAGEYAAYSRLFTSQPLLRLIFMLVYYSFITYLLVCYYRKASHSDILVFKPARWVIFLFTLSLISAFSSVMSFLLPRKNVFSSVYIPITAFVISGQFILLTFHIIRRKYLLYAVHGNYESMPVLNQVRDHSGTNYASKISHHEGMEQKTDRQFHSGKLTRHRLNVYFRKQKPYLQADYKMIDLAEAMDVNRSVLSAFINRNYGMNFNRFVNQWRLKELKRLQALPSNKSKSVMRLVTKVGFADLRQYFRAKSNQPSIT